jgi:hypothetical protein
MDVLRRNNVRVLGAAAGQPMIFAHGFANVSAPGETVEAIRSFV